MKIGELFVEVGITGTTKTNEGLKSIKDSLNGIRETSLAAKAALVAVAYGIYQSTSAFGEKAIGLSRFNNEVGVSTTLLQQWQIAGRAIHIDPEAVTQSFKNIRGIIDEYSNLGTLPANFEQISGKVKIDLDQMKGKDGPQYLMNKLMEFAKKVPEDSARQFLKGIVSDDMITLLIKNKKEIEKIKSSLIMSPAQIAAAAKLQEDWKLLFDRVSKRTAETMLPISMFAVEEFSHAFNTVEKLFKKIDSLDQGKLPHLKETLVLMGGAVAAAWAPITAMVTGLVYILADIDKFDPVKFKEKMRQGKDPEGLTELFMNFLAPSSEGRKRKEINEQFKNKDDRSASINTNLIFNGVGPEDTGKIKNETQNAVFNAYVQALANARVA